MMVHSWVDVSILMLAKIAPRFVVSRVIQNAYYADYMAVELVKEIIEPEYNTFHGTDPKKFYVPPPPLRSATSTATSPPSPPPLSLPTSLKRKSTWRQSTSSATTMKSEPSWRGSASSWWS